MLRKIFDLTQKIEKRYLFWKVQSFFFLCLCPSEITLSSSKSGNFELQYYFFISHWSLRSWSVILAFIFLNGCLLYCSSETHREGEGQGGVAERYTDIFWRLVWIELLDCKACTFFWSSTFFIFIFYYKFWQFHKLKGFFNLRWRISKWMVAYCCEGRHDWHVTTLKHCWFTPYKFQYR